MRHESSPIDSAVNVLYSRLLSELQQDAGAARITSLVSEVEAMDLRADEKKGLMATLNQAIELAERIEQYQLNERALRALSDSAKSLTELKQPDSVLNGIVMQGRELLGSDLAWLAMQDHDGSRLVAINGGHTEHIKNMVARHGSGIAGYVSQSKSTFTTQGYLADNQFTHDASVDRAIEQEGLVSVVAAPILAEDSVIGILIVADRYRRTYRPWEISILVALSAHASVAIRNARFFEQKQQAIQDAEDANQHLQDKIEVLEFAADAHERLTALLAQGSNQLEIVELIANLLEGQAAFSDPSGRVLCSARGKTTDRPLRFAKREPVALDLLDAVEESRYRGRAVPLREPSQPPALVMAVSSGEDHLGAIIVEPGLALSEDRIRIFEHCAAAIAVLTLLDEKKAASSLQDMQETLQGLLEGATDTGPAAARALKLGLDVFQPFHCLVITADASKLHYMARQLNARLRGYGRLAAQVDGTVVMLVNSEAPDEMVAAVEKLIGESLGLPALICMSSALNDLAALPGHHRQCLRALRVASQLGRDTGVIREEEYYLYDVLFSGRDRADIDRFINTTIGALIDHDKKRKTRLCETLSVFLDLQQNARATARSLNVHVNTVHNRLETITWLLGEGFGGNQTLELHLALRLHELRCMD